ncbi:MAG: hypothetical protein WBP97_20195, partial [Candidatus Sulfotelmatobacter sp.]
PFHLTLCWRGAAGRVALIPGYNAARANRRKSAVNGGMKTGRLRITDQLVKSRWLRINLSTVCLL